MTTLPINDYAIFIVDITGVIYDGASIINGALETLKKLKSLGKTVLILSNNNSLGLEVKDKHRARGLVEGQHYDELFTSGDYFKYLLENGKLEVEGNKYYAFGAENAKIFKNTDCLAVDSLEEADFIYIGRPQLTAEKFNSLTVEEQEECIKSPNSELWDCLDVSIFEEEIEAMARTGLTAIGASGDRIALRLGEDGKTHPVIRQGSIMDVLKNKGAKTISTAKPAAGIYACALEALQRKLGKWGLNNQKMLMVGDTLESDVLGARNATNELGLKVDALLVRTGVTQMMLEGLGITPEECCQLLNAAMPDYVMDSIAELNKIL